jgi:acetylornithine/N-succinyldiaminopimelate aminotransferase
VQCGIGRTGKLFAHEWAGVTPDIDGDRQGHRRRLPDGRLPRHRRGGEAHDAGTHGTTFGGNPLAMAVGNAVLDVVLEPGFLDEVSARRCSSSRVSPSVGRASRRGRGIRGEGLMLGSRCKHAGHRGEQGAARPSSCSRWPPATTSCASCRR